MALSHVLLTSLLEKPSSGYDLARRFDKSMGFFWNATHQQIYRELSNMERAGWITSTPALDAGKTKKKTYSVLPAGIEVLKQWAQQQAEITIPRDELMVRLRAEAVLGPLGLEQEIQRHLQLHEQQLALYEQIAARDFNGKTLNREQQIQAMILELGIALQHTWIDWAKQAERVFKQLDQPDIEPHQFQDHIDIK